MRAWLLRCRSMCHFKCRVRTLHWIKFMKKDQPNYSFSSDLAGKMISHTEKECDGLKTIRSLSLCDCLRWHRCYRCQTHYTKLFNWNQYSRTRSVRDSTNLASLLQAKIPTFIVYFFSLYSASMSNHHILLSLSKHTTDRSQYMWLLLSGMHSHETQYNYPAIRNACAIHINVLHCCAHHFTQTTKIEREKEKHRHRPPPEAETIWESQNTQMIRILPIFISVTGTHSLFHSSQLSPRIKWKFTHIVTSRRSDARHRSAHIIIIFFFLRLIYYRIFSVNILPGSLPIFVCEQQHQQRGETMILPNRTKGVYDNTHTHSQTHTNGAQ